MTNDPETKKAVESLTSFWRERRTPDKAIELRDLQDGLTFAARMILGDSRINIGWSRDTMTRGLQQRMSYGQSYVQDESTPSEIILDSSPVDDVPDGMPIPDELVDVLVGDMLFRCNLIKTQARGAYREAREESEIATWSGENRKSVRYPQLTKYRDRLTPTGRMARGRSAGSQEIYATLNPLAELDDEIIQTTNPHRILEVIQHLRSYVMAMTSPPAVQQYVTRSRGWKAERIQPIMDALAEMAESDNLDLQTALDIWSLYSMYGLKLSPDMNTDLLKAILESRRIADTLVDNDVATDMDILAAIRDIARHFSKFSYRKREDEVKQKAQEALKQSQSSDSGEQGEKSNQSQKADDQAKGSDESKSDDQSSGGDSSSKSDSSKEDEETGSDNDEGESESDQPEASEDDETSEDGTSDSSDKGEDADGDSEADDSEISESKPDELSDFDEDEDDDDFDDWDEDEKDDEDEEFWKPSPKPSQQPKDKTLEQAINVTGQGSVLQALSSLSQLSAKDVDSIIDAIETDRQDLSQDLIGAGYTSANRVSWQKGKYDTVLEETLRTDAYSQATGISDILRRFSRLRSRYEHGLSDGIKLDRRRLYRFGYNSQNIWMKRTVIDRLDMAMVLLMDSSGSVSYESWDLITQTVASFVQAFVNRDDIELIATAYSGAGGCELYRVWDNQMRQLCADRPAAGSTPSQMALAAMRESVFGRLGIEKRDKIIIHLTDGQPNEGNASVKKEVEKNREAGIETFCILVGRYYGAYSQDKEFIDTYGADHFVSLKSFDQLLPALTQMFEDVVDVR